MAAAFAEARQVKGKTLPNPPVGAVVVKAGRLVAKGGTRPAGGAHAEVVALERAGGRARGATLFVTLEPCCHHGRTPPCTLAILRAGVARVVLAVRDPFARVDGGGVRDLRRAGVRVDVGLMRAEALSFYEGYFFYARYGRPLIRLKIAQSLDGRINEAPGRETAITGAKAGRFSHELRTRVDAILIGAGTLRADDPELTPRLVAGPHPECIVLSGHGDIPARSRLLRRGRRALTIIATWKRRRFPSWVEAELLPGASDPSATVRALLALFRKRGYHSVLVEGGPSVWALFLNSGRWDRLDLITAPKVLPQGQRWDKALAADWGKSLILDRFAGLGEDWLWSIRNRTAP